MTKETWCALLTCIVVAENSDSDAALEDARKARTWLERQDWDDD